ncbi:hypothetical protein IscW_ISCW019241 [Ixodes scapularis]|uniref:Uncharacterized protein n=1 Tax=Ixodes scapularis TaxID=6945 RepID=B7PR35_IXOSC|nr:hypothetical protein IscW_ISCW019241 [Ixodes scapularis]|eukprot:XP_002436227.1 hypothetical protein IscW_ISCW019241 [Ixodes scapularis]
MKSHSTRLIIAIRHSEKNRAHRDAEPPLSPRPRPLRRRPGSEEGRPLSPHKYEQGVPASPGPAPSPPRASPERPASPTLSPVVAGDRCGGVGTPPAATLTAQAPTPQRRSPPAHDAATATKVSSHRFLWRQRHGRQGGDRGGKNGR